VHEIPGYRINPFVTGFIESPAGAVPRVSTRLYFRDLLGTVRARTGIARNRYKVNPGLYCTGSPDAGSPVFVTANYKLSFDSLRRELPGINAWILVVDTRGINVWCAAGKKTFSADEVAFQVLQTRLGDIVSHRELILPQLAATGVAAHTLKKKCGFSGIFGPLRAADISGFLKKNKQADERMRSVTFTLGERLILVPVEIALIWKPFLLVTLAIFILSGISPDLYSPAAVWTRGLTAAGSTVMAILAGALLTPLLLPWIPGRQFWLKGLQIGILAGFSYLFLFSDAGTLTGNLALLLWTTAAASFMAMNFTGATPFTSLSGVEKEMRRGLPVQIGVVFLALILWISAPFIG